MIKDWLEICREISKETGIPIEEVKGEILAYTRDIKENARDMTNVEIYLFGIGILKVRRTKLKEFINRITSRIKKLEKKTKTERVIEGIKENRQFLAHLQELLDKLNYMYSKKKKNLRKR